MSKHTCAMGKCSRPIEYRDEKGFLYCANHAWSRRMNVCHTWRLSVSEWQRLGSPHALVTAKITGRKHSPNPHGSSICAVTCPRCEHSRTVSYGGWSALKCGCGAELTRFKRKEVPSE